jgi:hypothetical protein
MRRLVNSLFALVFMVACFAQRVDTLAVNEASFLKQVYQFAPSVLNSGLQVDIQNQEWLAAKAVFEPKLGGTYAAKNYGDKLYYSKLDAGVKVKTPLGVKVTGGYTQNEGVFLNPEGTVPLQGIAYAGIEIPLGAGLFTDEDRTYIKQQRIENNAAGLVNQLEINDHLLSSGVAYWHWYESIMLLKLSQEAIEQAKNRWQYVILQNKIGEAADIDTLEAFINYQNRQAFLLESTIKWEKYRNYILNFLWKPELQQKLVAPLVDIDYEAQFPDSFQQRQITQTHPYVQLLVMDSMINQTNLMLAKEYYKPQVDLAFKLQEDGGSIGNFNYNPTQNNYVGLNVYMPIFLRKQRAKSEQAVIKNEVIGNKKKEALVKLENAQRTYYQNTINLKQSLDLLEVTNDNYKRMLDAEQAKFNAGESSLFIVNNRELKWIESREKYIKTYSDYRKSILDYYHSLGILPQIVQ